MAQSGMNAEIGRQTDSYMKPGKYEKKNDGRFLYTNVYTHLRIKTQIALGTVLQ